MCKNAVTSSSGSCSESDSLEEQEAATEEETIERWTDTGQRERESGQSSYHSNRASLSPANEAWRDRG